MIIIIITTCFGATQPVLSSALEQYSVGLYIIHFMPQCLAVGLVHHLFVDYVG